MASITIQFDNKPRVFIECTECEAQKILEHIVFGSDDREHRVTLPSTELLLKRVMAHDDYEHCSVELSESFCPVIKNGGSERTRVVMNVSEKLRRIRENISEHEAGEWVYRNKKINDRRCKVYTFNKL